MNAATAPEKTVTYVSLRKHAGPWAPTTGGGVDASSDRYRRLIAAGWLPQYAWTVTEVEPGSWEVEDIPIPVPQYPRDH